MTITQLNLGNELNEEIQKHKTERQKYKVAFDIVTEDIKNMGEEVDLEINTFSPEQKETHSFPLEEFAEFLEHRIIKIDFRINELEQKFFQL
jgi:hypothetical protein